MADFARAAGGLSRGVALAEIGTAFGGPIGGALGFALGAGSSFLGGGRKPHRYEHTRRHLAWVRGCATYGLGSARCTPAQIRRQLSPAVWSRPHYRPGVIALRRLIAQRGYGV